MARGGRRARGRGLRAAGALALGLAAAWAGAGAAAGAGAGDPRGGGSAARALLSDPVPGTASGAAYEASREAAKGLGLPAKAGSLPERGSLGAGAGSARGAGGAPATQILKDLGFSWEKADRVVGTSVPLFVPDRKTDSEALIAAVAQPPGGLPYIPAS